MRAIYLDDAGFKFTSLNSSNAGDESVSELFPYGEFVIHKLLGFTRRSCTVNEPYPSGSFDSSLVTTSKIATLTS